MTKERVEVELQQPVATSPQVNQMITDYMTPGLLMCHTLGYYNNILGANIVDPLYLFWFPFSQAKNVFDRMRVHGYIGTLGGAVTTVEYTVNGGGAWAAVPAGAVTGLPLSRAIGTIANSLATDINIAAAAGPWIGMRLNFDVPANVTHCDWNYLVYLWSSTDTPF